MRHRNGLAFMLFGFLGPIGCASTGSECALPETERYTTADLQAMASQLQSTGKYQDEFGLEIHAKNVRPLSEYVLLVQSGDDGTPIFIRHKAPYDTTPASYQEKLAPAWFISLPDMLASGINARDALISLEDPRGQFGYMDVRAWHVTSGDGHTSGEIEFNTNKAYFGKKP